MPNVRKIHAGKTPMRVHYIEEWAERRGLTQVQIANAVGVDKSTVSRWYKGTIPNEKQLLPLALSLHLEEITDLFRDPDDTWFKRMFKGRSQKEIEDSKQLIKIHLGKTGNDG